MVKKLSEELSGKNIEKKANQTFIHFHKDNLVIKKNITMYIDI